MNNHDMPPTDTQTILMLYYRIDELKRMIKEFRNVVQMKDEQINRQQILIDELLKR